MDYHCKSVYLSTYLSSYHRLVTNIPVLNLPTYTNKPISEPRACNVLQTRRALLRLQMPVLRTRHRPLRGVRAAWARVPGEDRAGGLCV